MGWFACGCKTCDPCPCPCLLVKFTDLGSDCCEDVQNHRWVLQLQSTCDWFDVENVCPPLVVAVRATLVGTTLTVQVAIENSDIPPDKVIWFFTATVDPDCTTWINESLTFDHLETFNDPLLPCGDPNPETGSCTVSAIDCDCSYCTVKPDEMTLRLRGQAEEGSSTKGECCEAMFGDWVLPFTSGCTWQDEFAFCNTLTLLAKVEIINESVTEGKKIVTVQVKSGATVLIEIVWESVFTEPADCTIEVDLGNFTTYTENDTAIIDCVEPCDGLGDNVLNPSGAQSGSAGVCT